jgi:enterochelin esterase-like enzyme
MGLNRQAIIQREDKKSIHFACIFVYSDPDRPSTMPKSPQKLLLIFVLLALTACTPTTPAPVLTATPEATAVPATPTPSPLPAEPTATATPTLPACLNQPGKLESQSLTSSLLPKPLRFSVYLPPCYDKNTDQRYPVLYLLHGQTYTEDQWVRLGVPETADRLIAAGEVTPFIVVMPYDSDYRQPTEYKFGEALTGELLPWVDSHYRTRADRDDRAVGGLSRGAAWAVHFGLSEWKLFGAFGAHSLPVFWTDTPQVPGWLASIPRAQLPRIYMDMGSSDRELASTAEFEALLNEKNVPHTWILRSGFHDEAYWGSHVEEYLRWYAAGWGKTEN